MHYKMVGNVPGLSQLGDSLPSPLDCNNQKCLQTLSMSPGKHNIPWKRINELEVYTGVQAQRAGINQMAEWHSQGKRTQKYYNFSQILKGPTKCLKWRSGQAD